MCQTSSVRRFLVFTVVAILAACSEDEPDALLLRLNAIPGVHAEAVRAHAVGAYQPAHVYHVTIEQPIDHAVAPSTTFQQHMILHVTDPERPVVLEALGYGLESSRREVELIEMLGGNLLTVEHRFFESSKPRPLPYAQLTLEQEAADLHAIRVALAPVFAGTWLALGRSKGGATVLAYDYLYPDDVAGTVAYSAPVLFSDADERFLAFFTQVGDASCRAALTAFQRAALTRRGELLTLLDGDSDYFSDTYQQLGQDRALEHAIVGLAWSFWQHLDADHCQTIPPADAPAGELYDFVERTIGFSTDRALAPYRPYYYQAATQLGWPLADEAALADLLRYPGTHTAAVYAGDVDVPLAYDGSLMPAIAEHVAHDAARVLLVYGDADPWWAAAVDVHAANDSLRFDRPGGNHGTHLADLPAAEQDAAIAALARWLDLDPADIGRPRPAAEARARGILP